MMRKKIVFFIDSLTEGGAERVVSVLSKELNDRGYDVEIVMFFKRPIVYKIPESVHVYYAEDLPVTGLYGKFIQKIFTLHNYLRKRFYIPFLRRIHMAADYPKWNETKFFFYANYAMPYREFLKKRTGGTAFGFLIRSNISLAMAAPKLDLKTVFCERNNPIRPDMPRNIMKLRDQYYRCFDAGVFQTLEEADYYPQLKGGKKVIPNPLKENLPGRFEGKRRHEIVNFCRLSKQKRLDILIDAFQMILEKYPDYTLRIYGNGEEKENLLSYIREKKLTNQVFIEAFANDIHEKIVDAAMFVSTSAFEGLSNSMLEAMAIGLPCVCTDCDGGGARMMIKDHWNGLLVKKGNKEAVYKGMMEILDNPKLAEEISMNASKIRDDLNVNKIVEEWVSMI